MQETLTAQDFIKNYDVTRSPEKLRMDQFKLVFQFYDISYSKDNPVLAQAHRQLAERIGANMDQTFIRLLQDEKYNEVKKIVDMIPFRGGGGLLTPRGNVFTAISGDYEIMPVGVKRDGPDAHTYYPTDEEFADQLAALPEGTIIRIKDFGIATGGTGIELAQRMIAAGIKPEQIVMHGAVGTLYAKERMEKEVPGMKVLFEVEGEMPIERRAKILFNSGMGLDYMEAIQLSRTEEMNEHGRIRGEVNYLDKIRQSEGDPFAQDTKPFSFGGVRPKDWGDECYTSMNTRESVAAFITDIKFKLADNRQTLTSAQEEQLFAHYFSLISEN